MANITTAAGAQVSIGTTVAATTLTAFQADTYTPIGFVEDLGEFGDQANAVNFTGLADRRTRKAKGSYDAGDLTVTAGADPSDAGQTALVAAFASDLDYNVRVVLPDKITNAGTGTTIYFKGKIMSKRRNVGSVENVIRRMFTIAINSDQLEVAAS